MLDRSTQHADPLSDILSLLKPRNVACGAVDAGDACIAFPAGHGIKCHAVTAGEAWLAMDGIINPLHLIAGDCLILPHGRSYRLASDLNLTPIDYRIVLPERSLGHVTSWNGGGRATIVSATFNIDKRHADMLLDILPSVAHVHEDAERPALGRSLHQIMRELSDPQPGSRLIVDHLATTMLALALRGYAVHAGNGHVGWLFALADPQIGVVIGAMHEDSARRWTVQALAELAGMSRTSFAVRFKAIVGSAPITYLAQLRMMLASNRLSTSDDAIQVAAEALGYNSESAFSNAFKRHLGQSPRRFANRGFDEYSHED